MYKEPYTCLNMHKYIKVTLYITIIMQYDIMQNLSVYTIYIHICYTHIGDVNRSLHIGDVNRSMLK